MDLTRKEIQVERNRNWDDEYMEWADQELLVRQDLEEIRNMRRRKAENYRTIEFEEDKHGSVNITG